MDIEKIEEFAKEGDKNLDNFDVVVGFVQAEKPERQWFNKILNIITSKINQIIDYVDSINDGFFESIDSARLESPSLEISSMITRSYSGNRKGGGRYVRSSIGEVSQYPEQAWFRTADGAYWLLDEKQPTPEMFGAKGDLEYTLIKKGDLTGVNAETYGHRYLSGTNDINAFNAAMRYAKIKGCEKVVGTGNYFIKSYEMTVSDGVSTNYPVPFDYQDESEIEILINDSSQSGGNAQKRILSPSEYSVSGSIITLNTALTAGIEVWISQKFMVKGSLDIAGTIWVKYAVHAQGVSVATRSHYKASLTIGQLTYNGSKPSNNGQMGTILGIGSGYYIADDHEVIEHSSMTTELIRAARVTADSANGVAFQDSDPTQHCIGYGWIRDIELNIDPFDAATNVASGTLCMLHWGGKYTAQAGVESIDKTPYPVTKTYHPERVTINSKKFLSAADHGYETGFTLSSVIDCTIPDIKVDGVKLAYYWVSGDLSDAYAQGDQVGRVDKGNKIGHVISKNLSPSIYGSYIGGGGQSKFEFYDGTNIPLLRAGDIELTVKSHTFYCSDGTPEAIRLRNISGTVDLGICRWFGATKSMYVLGGNGKWSADIVDADCAAHVQNNKGGTLKRTNINVGSARNNTLSGLFEKGYESDNCTVNLEGGLYSTTLSASASVGATRIAINAFTSSFATVNKGDFITIKDGNTVIRVAATSLIVTGVPYLDITPLTLAVSSGATVTLDKYVSVDQLNMTSISSEFGLYSDKAIIKELDFSDMKWSGRHSAIFKSTTATITGRLPSSDSRRMVTTSDQAITADEYSRIVGVNLYVPSGSDGDEAIKLGAVGAQGAVLTLTGGVVENINTLAPTAKTPMNQVHLYGVVDLTGQLVIPQGRSGSNANGYWVKHEDGTMECLARNVPIGATQPYTWEFPQAFIETSSIYVDAISTSAVNSRVPSALATSATQAAITLTENAEGTNGTPSPATAGVNLYAKGFWKTPS